MIKYVYHMIGGRKYAVEGVPIFQNGDRPYNGRKRLVVNKNDAVEESRTGIFLKNIKQEIVMKFLMLRQVGLVWNNVHHGDFSLGAEFF